MHTYKRPPITEVVLEFLFASAISEDAIGKAVNALKKDYPFSEELVHINVNVDHIQQRVGASTQKNGSKVTSLDQADILIVSPQKYGYSRLAPYQGWDLFIERAMSGWSTVRKHSSHRQVSRIGLRYINRIDVPFAAGDFILSDKYLLIGSHVPSILSPMTQYLTHVEGPVAGSNMHYRVQTGTAQAALINHASFLLDIDLFFDSHIPVSMDAVWGLVATMRDPKNSIFEACVSDSARELFS